MIHAGDDFALGVETCLRVAFLPLLRGGKRVKFRAVILAADQPVELEALFEFVRRGLAKLQRALHAATADHQRATAAEQIVMLRQQVVADQFGTAGIADQPDIALIHVVAIAHVFNHRTQVGGVLLTVFPPGASGGIRRLRHQQGKAFISHLFKIIRHAGRITLDPIAMQIHH